MPPVVGDETIVHKYAKLYLLPQNQQGFDEDATSGVTTALGAGGGVLAEVSVAAAEINGLAMETGDELYWYLPIAALNGFDLTRDIHAQVFFESKKTGATAGVDFTFVAKGIALGQVLSDAKVSPDGTITFAAAASASPGILCATEQAALQVAGELSADKMVMFAVTLADDGDAAADDIVLLWVELTGTAQICDSSGIPQRT